MSLRNPFRLGQGRRRSSTLVPDGTEEIIVQSRDGKRDHYWSLADALSYFGGGVGSASLVTEAGPTRTLAAADAETLHRFVGATGCVVTIPLNSSEAIPIGAKYPLRQSAGISADGLVRVVPEDGVVLNLPTGIRPPRFMGCTASLTADLGSASYTSITTIDWDDETNDTDGFHVTSPNPSRLTIPASMGIKLIRLNAHLRLSSILAGQWVAIDFLKNGSALTIRPGVNLNSSSTFYEVGTVSHGLATADSDYFEMQIIVQSDATTVVDKLGSFLGLEVLQIDAQGTSAGPDTEFWVQKVDTDEWDIGGMFM